MTKRKLVLDDGTEFIGQGFGSNIKSTGELICFTGMTGYQEMLTDASYAGKFVVMTYPFIGAYGINRDDFESVTVAVQGLIVKEISDQPVNFRSEETVDHFLKRNDVPGISGIDTRKLTRHLRNSNVKYGQLIDVSDEFDSSLLPHTTEALIEQATTPKPYVIPGRNKRVVVLDLGVKQSIIRELTEQGLHITVVPYNYSVEELNALRPDGIVVSNGPGNPQDLTDVIETLKSLNHRYPLLGIGLGHQLIGLAHGASVVRLAIGEYGTNIPVKDLKQDKTWITTMSHDYVIEMQSVPGDLKVTHKGLNNNAVAGLTNEDGSIISVQFHPEGAPGSTETNAIFDAFIKQINLIENNNGGMQHA